MFGDGYLALASVISGAAVTEFSGAGYARQPVSFSVPRNGLSTNSVPWSFYSGLSGTLAGRAVFDAPVSGELLFTLPFVAPRPLLHGASDAREVGGIILSLTALAGFFDGAAFTGHFLPGDTLGQTWDPVYDKTGTSSTSAGPVDTFQTAAVIAGCGLTVIGGRMYSTDRFAGATP